MNDEGNDTHWKELADYLKKLNVDFYWRTQNMVHERADYHPDPPPKPPRTGRISMVMNQEHTPSPLSGDEGSTPSKKSEDRDRRPDSPERWLI